MNHYEILGVDKNSTEDQIKQAYKKLVMKHHPDRGGDNERFAQINAAYDILKDPVKRNQYDNGHQRRYTTSNNFTQEGFDFNFFNEFFEQTFKNYSVHTNRDITLSINLSLDLVFKKNDIQINYQTTSGKTESTTVSIPPGIKNGDMIKITEMGDDADSRFPRGNLNIKIYVQDTVDWRRNNNDLWHKQTVDVFDLLLGCAIIITTLEGNDVKLNIPRGSKTTSVFSIPNHGVPDRVTGLRGNIYVQIETSIPTIDDTSIIDKLTEIKKVINNKENN